MAKTADLIITDARIRTMNPDQPQAEALAVADGRILAVGTTKEIQALASTDTQVISAGGASVLPGFSESHMHLFSGAAELAHCQLGDIQGFDALKEAVTDYAARHPEHPVILCQGASYSILSDSEPLTRHHLDRILPDRPLTLFAYDHHTAWTNTAALTLTGLLQGRAMPPGNEVVMGTDGLATGELREMAAFDPIVTVSGYGRYRMGLATGEEPSPFPSQAEFERDMEIMLRGLTYCASFGITSIQNMDGNHYQLQVLSALLERDGRLPARVKIPFHFKPHMTPDALERASMMTARYNNEWLTSGLVKLFHDGVLESWTAVMVDNYADAPERNGDPLFATEHFNAAIAEADRRGLQVAVHAIGDRAVRETLNAYEHARGINGRRDSRHRVEHIEVVHPDDIDRFAALGVIASMQPPHPPGSLGLALLPTIDRIGRHRWKYSYAWRTLKTAGARIPFSSDWPVSNIDPIAGIEAAVTRKPWGPEDIDQSFTLEEALAAYTSEGAFAEFAEDRKGQIRPGYLADIVILSKDIAAVEPSAIRSVRVAKTVCGGVVTYSAD